MFEYLLVICPYFNDVLLQLIAFLVVQAQALALVLVLALVQALVLALTL